jgi:hypothetical protein
VACGFVSSLQALFLPHDLGLFFLAGNRKPSSFYILLIDD